MRQLLVGVLFSLALSTPSYCADLEGPGRFCGYAPIIDLLPGESITVLKSGIHGGSFRWDGAFGSLDVLGRYEALRNEESAKATALQGGISPRRRVRRRGGREGIARGHF